MNKAFSIQDVKDRLLLVHSGMVTILEESYIKFNEKARFLDRDYGEFYSYCNKVVSGAKHPIRARKEKDNTNLKLAHTHSQENGKEQFIKYMKDIDHIILIGEYTGARTKTIFLDKDHGEFVTTPMHIKRGQNHPSRSKINRIVTNNQLYGGNAPACSVDVQNKMKNTSTIKYGNDNYTKTKKYKDLIREKDLISITSWGQDVAEFISEMNLQFAKSTLYRIVRENPTISKDKMIERCKKIGEVFVSENKVRALLEEMYCKPFPKKRINGYELDGYCEELKLAFEYDGYQHFKQAWYDKDDKRLKNTKKRDIEKNLLCESLSITLIRIPYTIVDIKSFLLDYKCQKL